MELWIAFGGFAFLLGYFIGRELGDWKRERLHAAALKEALCVIATQNEVIEHLLVGHARQGKQERKQA